MSRILTVALAVLAPAALIAAPRSAIIVDVVGEADPIAQVRAAVRAEFAAMNRHARGYLEAQANAGVRNPQIPFIAPRVAMIRQNGELLRGGGSPEGGGITLQFVGFPSGYQQVLQNTFNSAKPTIDVLFGQPFQGGTVKVINVDDTIPDREAVIGGVYIPDDGTGTPAILFPVYNAPEAAAVNFIHTLYLAYIGPAMFDFDAWSEGFARAATMRTSRITGALPAGMDPEIVLQVIEGSYDTSAHYSWYNQPALGNDRFIAPNLRELSLPPGGSLGGIYLMRYRQAGTAWAKVLTQYPAFFSTFLQQYYQDPGISGNVPALKALAQSTLNDLAGGPGTIEGRTFEHWHRRQHILDTSITRGRKMLVEPIPITSGLGGPDFGVFAIWATYFDTLAGGNELLLSGTSFPLFWDADFGRLFTGGQDDRMDISAAFGTVTPNFPDVYGVGGPTQWYKATVELPVSDTISRVLLPAGGIASASQPLPRNFYGTVMGFDGARAGGPPNVSGAVRLTVPGFSPIDAPLRNGAFSALIVGSNLNQPRVAQVQVVRIDGVEPNVTETVLHTETVNTWGPVLGLDIRLNEEGTFVPIGGLTAGIQMVGFPVRPFNTSSAAVLGLPASQTMVARWRQEKFGYGLWPSVEPFDYGRGFYVRLPSAQPGFMVQGKLAGEQPMSVPLQVGWNQIANPFGTPLEFSEVSVQRGAEFPVSYTEAILQGWIGAEMFAFTPGAPDPHSGVPEGGTLSPASSFPVGAAVFVRVLVAEGVTITFRTSGFALLGRSVAPPTQRGWRGNLRFSGLGVEVSAVEIGQSPGATASFDQGIDALLPPIWGGALQAQIQGSSPLYRDLCGAGPAVWTVRLTGLRTGATYTLNYSQVVHSGSQPNIGLYDPIYNRGGILRHGSTYTFVARSAEHRFTIAGQAGGF